MAVFNNNKGVDMLHGSLMDKIIWFALPAAMSGILQQLLNAIDVAIVGRYAGSIALAAVGTNGEVINFIINLIIGISMGSNVLISNYIGGEKLSNVKKAVHTTLVLALIIGLLCLLVGQFTAASILNLIKVPKEIFDAALLYLQLYLWAMPFIVIFNFGSAILRCVGDTKRPLYALIFSGIINAALNWILVAIYGLGVVGVAIATVASYVVSSSIIVVLLLREEGYLQLCFKELKITLSELKEILRLGIPTGIQSCIFCLANIALQSQVNTFGPAAIAGASVSQTFVSLNYYFISGFEYATATFVSQNYAAKLYNRCKRAIYCALIANIAITLFTSWCTLFFRFELIGLITKDSEVTRYADIRLWILLLPYIISAIYEVLSYGLRGMGYANLPTVLMVTGICVFRLLWLLTVQEYNNTYEMLHLVYPSSWLFTDILMSVAIIYAFKKLKRKL